jgi:hypothetical protein
MAQAEAQHHQADGEDDPWRYHDQVASSHLPCPYAAVLVVLLCSTSAPRTHACPV